MSTGLFVGLLSVLSVVVGFFALYFIASAIVKTLHKAGVPAGYKFLTVDILGRIFTLVEISALQRLEYLKRCMKLNASDGFEFMRDDLVVSTDLIALHLRRWYLPRWVIAYRLRQLSAGTIAELFRSCVTLSNLPFSITSDDEPQRSDPSLEPVDDLDNEWDYVDDEGEKKKRPAVHQ